MKVSASVLPFHNNVDTPAGKIYQDKYNGDVLFCFSEQKRYRPSEVLARRMVKGKTVAYIFKNVWSQISDEARKSLIDQYGKPVSQNNELWEKNSHILCDFKYGKIDFTEWLVRVKMILS